MWVSFMAATTVRSMTSFPFHNSSSTLPASVELIRGVLASFRPSLGNDMLAEPVVIAAFTFMHEGF